MRSPVEKAHRIAVPRRRLGPEIRAGQVISFDTAHGVAFRGEVVRAELHHTKLRAIRRGECIQTAWRTYRGKYWLLTLRTAKRREGRRART